VGLTPGSAQGAGLRHVGTPRDIAEIVAWLLDGDRSGFVTGENFMVDGGMSRKMIYEQ
jgi:NAD(P)-dependent dehydrogenase (short-subunit alcohol dehydrogenase family)